MIDRQWIDERGWRTDLAAPLTAVDDRPGRLAQLADVVAAFAPVLRPLAAEVVMCWRSLDIGLPSEDALWPRRHIFAVAGAQSVIAVRPWYAEPLPIEVVPAIDAGLIAAGLDSDVPPEPGMQQDWLEVRMLAVALRAFTPIQAIELERVGRTVAPYEADWFAGPVGQRDLEIVAPAELVVLSEGRVTLMLAVHWSRWLSVGTHERAAIEAALSALAARGWIAQ